MADDPERDLLPVKDCAPYEDVYAPHISKLDRKTLEDRYLRLLLENEHLKKQSHKQEDKIKRLATKLLRLLAEQKRDIPVAQRRAYTLDSVVMEQQRQIQELQQSNCHLQNKITVLRNQLAEHSSMHSASHCSNKLRSPARSPARRIGSAGSKAQASVSSPDSQNMLQPRNNPLCLKSQDSPTHKGTQHCDFHKKNPEAPVDSAAIKQNQQLSQEVMRLNEEIRILEQELETQKEQSNLRIAELEEELANNVADDERQKIAKNVEMIQLQRSLQQQTAQLTANFAKIQVLEREVEKLQQELEVSQQENDEVQCQLAKERQKLIDKRVDLQKFETDRLSIRELEEQIRDLQNEKTALKDHNERLLSLMSSRQKLSSEQEATLRSQVTHLEDMLSRQQGECSHLKQELEKTKQVASQNQKSSGKEKDLQIQVEELESALTAERNEKSNLKKYLHDMQVKISEFKVQDIKQNSDVENRLQKQVANLEVKLSEVLSERSEMADSLKEEREQVEALKITQKDLIKNLQELQTRHSKLEEQLHLVKQIPTIREETSDRVKFTSSQLQVIPSRIPSLEESRCAHKIPSAQLEDSNKDSEISHSITETSISTSVAIENKSFAEAESEGMFKSDIHNISLESETKDSVESVEKSRLSEVSESKDNEEVMKKQIIDDIIKSILAKTTTVIENSENECSNSSFNQQRDKNDMTSVKGETIVNRSIGQKLHVPLQSPKREGINIVIPPSSQILDVEIGKELSSYQLKIPVSSTVTDKMGILKHKQNITSATKENNTFGSPYVKENQKRLEKSTKKAIPSSYYTHLSTLLLASLTKATSKTHSPSIFQSITKNTTDSEKFTSEHEDTMDESLKMDISGLEPINSDDVNSMAAASDESRTDTANKIDMCRELEKCRELLRVQYNLTSLYKKEVANLATQLNEKETEENKLIDESSKKQEVTQSEYVDKLPTHSAPPKSEENKCSHLTVKPGEGVFEIHIQCLELYPESFQNLTCHVDIPSLFLTWFFYNQDVAYTPLKKVETVMEFDSSSVYRTTVDNEFLDYLLKGKCVVEVHMTVDDASEPVARGTIRFLEVLEFPQNKIHSTVPLVGINEHENAAGFGNIQCWFRLSCSIQIVNDYIRIRNITDFTNSNVLCENSAERNQSSKTETTLTKTKGKRSQTSRATIDSGSDERGSEENTSKKSRSSTHLNESRSLKNEPASGSSTKKTGDTSEADLEQLIFEEPQRSSHSQRNKIEEEDKVEMQLNSPVPIPMPRTRRLHIKNIA